jgi:hypothetical protein
MWSQSTLTRHDIAGRTSPFDALKFWADANCSLTCQNELNVFILQEAPLHPKELKCHNVILGDKYENIKLTREKMNICNAWYVYCNIRNNILVFKTFTKQKE